MATAWYLGLDGGNTKTDCALQGPACPRMELVRGGPSNPETVGFETAADTVNLLVAQTLERAGATRQRISAACFAMAGMDLPPDRDAIRRQIVDPLELSCPIVICNDVFAGFRAGSPCGVGMCVSAGTGITFCGRNCQGETLQFEHPKPESLDQRVRKMLIAEYLGIGPPCSFREEYLETLGISSLKQYYWTSYANRDYTPKLERQRERNARVVLFRPTYHCDTVLCRIFERYASDIAEFLIALGKRLRLGTQPFELVLSGSQFVEGKHPILNARLMEFVRNEFPICVPVLVDGPPVRGALRMAAELAHQPRGRGRGAFVIDDAIPFALSADPILEHTSLPCGVLAVAPPDIDFVDLLPIFQRQPE